MPDFDSNVQGVHKVVTLEAEEGSGRLLVFHTVEDGAASGTYWVLARHAGGTRWESVKQEGVVPRLHPKNRETITSEETIDETDAESILFLCECAQWEEDGARGG